MAKGAAGGEAQRTSKQAAEKHTTAEKKAKTKSKAAEQDGKRGNSSKAVGEKRGASTKKTKESTAKKSTEEKAYERMARDVSRQLWQLNSGRCVSSGSSGGRYRR